MSVLTRFDRHARLYGDMADTVGVDLSELAMRGALEPGDFRNAIFRCVGCTRPDACKDWVAAHPDGAARAPDYCRNKVQLARLSRD